MKEDEPTHGERPPSDTDHDAIPSADDVTLPTVEEIVSTNGALRLLDEEWKHPETRPADPSEPPAGGDPSLDWASLRRTNDMWARLAMKKYGRVGRDPARIEPFLRYFEAVWERHPQTRFGELVSDVLSVIEPGMALHAPEEETFVRLLGDWDDATAARQERDGSPIGEPSGRSRTDPRIARPTSTSLGAGGRQNRLKRSEMTTTAH
jgi:hypothetical protein